MTVRRNIVVEDMFGRKAHYDLDVIKFDEAGLCFLAKCWDGYKEFKYHERKSCFIFIGSYDEIPEIWQDRIGDPRQLEFNF